jgi:hypothetical protein
MENLMSKWFGKWAKKSRILTSNLLLAIKNVDNGNAVDLGGGLYKVRIARENQGKSGGYRSLLIFKKDNIALFIHGFAKNEQDNISESELALFKKQAKYIFSFDETKIQKAIEAGEFIKLKEIK